MFRSLSFLLVLGITISACGQNNSKSTESSQPATTEQNVEGQPGVQRVIVRSEVPIVTVEEAIELAKQGYQFVDLRTPAEIADGKIEGAMELNVRTHTIIAEVNELDPNSKLILYCESGTRSSLAAKLFSELNFPNVVDMSGGYSAWVKYHNK